MASGDKNRLQAAVLGASEERGTGWAIVEALAARGAHVWAGARRLEGVQRLAGRIGGSALRCDATLEDDVSAFAQAAAAATGRVEIAVLAAGKGFAGTIDSMPPEALRACLELNFVAATSFIRHFARHMGDGGAIVLISSIAATNPWPGYFGYGAAKAALQALVRYAALEYAPRGIRVNAVAPGPIRTPGAEALFAHKLAGPVMTQEMPLGRPATPQEVAEAVAWLAMGPSWVTGETLHVDGGLHLRRAPDVEALRAALAH